MDVQPNIQKRVGHSNGYPERRPPIQLHNLIEIRELWGKGKWAVLGAVQRGDLRPVARPGHQPYYLHDELVAAFGEPARRLTGPYGYSFELAIGA